MPAKTWTLLILLCLTAPIGVRGGGATTPADTTAPGATATVDTAARELARRVQAHHEQVGDLTARFEQTYRSAALGDELVESGVLSVKRPGLMHWEYRKPEAKVFISDGERFWFYVPADRQVIVRQSAGANDLPALLLAGESHLLDHFVAALEAPPAPGRRRLRLTPREADPEIASVLLDVDEAARILSIEVRDSQDNLSRFRFDAIRENVGVSPKLFRFEVPDGVEVIEG